MKIFKQPIVPATLSMVLAPLLLVVQGTCAFLGSMIIAEDNNPAWSKVIAWVVMLIVACFAIALPTFALIRAVRDRKLNGAGNKLKTVLSIMFASVAFAIMVAAQVWTLPALIPQGLSSRARSEKRCESCRVFKRAKVRNFWPFFVMPVGKKRCNLFGNI